MQYQAKWLLSFVCLLSVSIEGQPVGIQPNPSEDGSPYSRVPDGSSALSSPFITPQYNHTATPYNGSGISPFTGQMGYSIPLASINNRGRVAYSINLAYSGKTRDPASDDNLTSPTSWLGLGWSLQAPYISRNHKGTFNANDDVFYADLGKGQIVRGASGAYYLTGNPYLIFTATPATTGVFVGQIETWTIKTLDGSLYVFGDGNGTESPSERIAWNVNGPVRVSPYSIGNAATQPFIYQWDLRKITDAEQKNRIDLDYQKTSINLFASGKNYTRESYLKSVKYMDRSGAEAERIEFILGDKPADEYVNPPTERPVTTMEPMQTKYLSVIRLYQNGTESLNYTFTYLFHGAGLYRKRLLDEVRTTSRLNPKSNTFIAAPIWKCTYDASRFSLLTSVQKPTGGKTDYEYSLATLGTSAQQPVYSDANNRLKSDGTTVVTFPNSSAWENTSSCGERHCILGAKDGNKVGGKLYLEFSGNRGNYVDAGIFRRVYTATSTTVASNWKWAGAGDYVVAYDVNAALVYVHEWDGVNWSFKFQADFGPVAGASNPLSVYVAANYFVVYQSGNPLNKAWVYLKQGNAWTRLNSGTTCDIDNNTSYGETVKNSGYGCLEFNSTLKVAVNANYFTLLYENTDILFTYALNKAGSSFTNVSGTFLNFGEGIQHATYANNWSQNITSMVPGPDYLVVQSTNATQQRIDVMHFDGVNIRRVANSGWETGVAADLTVATAENYFVSISQATGVVSLWRRATISGGFTFTRTQARTGVPTRANARITLRAFPEAFTFEYGRLTEDISGQPIPILEGTTDLSSWLYQVDPTATNGVRDRSSDIRYTVAGGTTKLFGISITPDNFLGGITLRNTSTQSAVCPVGGTCTPFFATLKIKRGETTSPYAYNARAVDGLSGPSLNKHVAFKVARTGMLSWFDGTAQVVKYRHFAFDGDDFTGAPENIYVVTKILERSGVDASGTAPGVGPDIIQTLAYDLANAEYNTHLQLSQFPKCTQKQIAGLDGSDQGRTEILYNMDSPNSKWYGRTLRLNGTGKEVQTYNQAGNMISLGRKAFRPFSALVVPADWPVSIPLVRLASTLSQDIRPNGSKMTTSTTYSNFNNVNGQPHFTKTFQDDLWKINQSLFDARGQYFQGISFSIPYATYPGTGPDLEVANPAVPFNTTNAVSSNKIEYDPANPYFPLKTHTWKDIDESLDEVELQAGTEPVYDLNQNWFMTSEVTRRNTEFQVSESRFVKSTVAGGESFTSHFYEGRKHLPVGTVSNAQWVNCALLQGENGDISGMSSLDLDNRWTANVDYTNTQIHTGRYALKVTDGTGPSTTLNLQNVRRDGFGYLASAWIYRPPNSVSGGLRVERYNAAGTKLNTYEGVYRPQDSNDWSTNTTGRWERWEVKLTNADLIAGGLFNGAADYLRVWIGTGPSTGNLNNVIYVDDIVCRPSNSTFSLTSYDYRGNMTSTTDTQHKTSTPETDYAGNVVGVRDERGRIYTQGSANRIGEN
jgi:hypothetical protein